LFQILSLNLSASLAALQRLPCARLRARGRHTEKRRSRSSFDSASQMYKLQRFECVNGECAMYEDAG